MSDCQRVCWTTEEPKKSDGFKVSVCIYTLICDWSMQIKVCCCVYSHFRNAYQHIWKSTGVNSFKLFHPVQAEPFNVGVHTLQQAPLRVFVFGETLSLIDSMIGLVWISLRQRAETKRKINAEALIIKHHALPLRDSQDVVWRRARRASSLMQQSHGCAPPLVVSLQ